MACSIDHSYQVLGIDPSASPEEVKRAHRDLVQVWHPDRFMANPRLQKLAQEKLLEINEAYDRLRSPSSAAPVVEPPPPAAVPPQRPSRQLREWLNLGAQAAGIAAVVFALILSARGFHRLVSYKTPPAEATVLPELEDPPSPRLASRRSRSNSTPEYMTNGKEIIERRGPAGVGRVTVNNQTDQDAVATLVDQTTGSTIRMVYVTAGMEAAIDGIGPGVYRMSLDSGSAWSWGARAFTRDRTIPRSIGPFTFTQVQTAGQLRGDQYSIVLRQDRSGASEMSRAGM